MKKGQKQALAIGAGAAALAAAAAGAYFLTGEKGKKNRKTIGAWATKAKKEVVAELKGLEKVSRASYNQAVDEVTKRYKGLKNIDAAELMMVAKELKGHWDTIAKQATKAGIIKKAPARKTATKKLATKSKAKAKK